MYMALGGNQGAPSAHLDGWRSGFFASTNIFKTYRGLVWVAFTGEGVLGLAVVFWGDRKGTAVFFDRRRSEY
ncbi:hypothetical protein WAI453_002022 [Rhynchosporium graminicola]